MSLEWVAPSAAAVVTGGFGVWIAKITTDVRRQVTPSNGVRTAEHIEAVALGVAQVSADLSSYKLEQAEGRAADIRQIEGYVAADAEAHAEMRGCLSMLSAQVQALSTPPPRPDGTDGASQ